jgi:hypothetical protein
MERVTKTAEWKMLKDLAIRVTNAVLADDDVLERYLYEEMKRVGNSLLMFSGRDPVVLETLADFAPDFSEARRLFQEAIQLIDTNNGDSTSPRMSLAELILEHERSVEEPARLILGIDEAGLSSDDKTRLADIRGEINNRRD